MAVLGDGGPFKRWEVLGSLRVLLLDSFKRVVPEFRGLASSPAALLLSSVICRGEPLEPGSKQTSVSYEIN